jgi:inositol transport system permease protein
MLIAYTAIPPFIATLGTQIAFRGAALMVTQGRPVSNINPAINIFGRRIFGYIPMPVIIYVICIAIIWVLMNYTAFG